MWPGARRPAEVRAIRCHVVLLAMVLDSILASAWETIGTLLTVLTPLVAVPLTMITFYLRSLREHQVSWHVELVRRIESVEVAAVELRKTLGEFERDYTTKEEWLRESMHARRMLEQLTEMTVRLDTTLRTGTTSARTGLHAGSKPDRAGPGMGFSRKALTGLDEDGV